MKSLPQTLKQSLLVAPFNACKFALHYPRYLLSFEDQHLLTNRAAPAMYCEYKFALQLFKTFNLSMPLL
jgi:hypothetical protein